MLAYPSSSSSHPETKMEKELTLNTSQFRALVSRRVTAGRTCCRCTRLVNSWGWPVPGAVPGAVRGVPDWVGNQQENPWKTGEELWFPVEFPFNQSATGSVDMFTSTLLELSTFNYWGPCCLCSGSFRKGSLSQHTLRTMVRLFTQQQVTLCSVLLTATQLLQHLPKGMKDGKEQA